MWRQPDPDDPCPCDSGRTHHGCCRPLLLGDAAPTAVGLMRSRYCAHVLGHADHLFRTWHPATRPARVVVPATTWRGLVVLRCEDGGPDDAHGVVAFEARYDGDTGPGVLGEVAAFERRAGRWVYRGPLAGE